MIVILWFGEHDIVSMPTRMCKSRKAITIIPSNSSTHCLGSHQIHTYHHRRVSYSKPLLVAVTAITEATCMGLNTISSKHLICILISAPGFAVLVPCLPLDHRLLDVINENSCSKLHRMWTLLEYMGKHNYVTHTNTYRCHTIDLSQTLYIAIRPEHPPAPGSLSLLIEIGSRDSQTLLMADGGE